MFCSNGAWLLLLLVVCVHDVNAGEWGVELRGYLFCSVFIDGDANATDETSSVLVTKQPKILERPITIQVRYSVSSQRPVAVVLRTNRVRFIPAVRARQFPVAISTPTHLDHFHPRSPSRTTLRVCAVSQLRAAGGQ